MVLTRQMKKDLETVFKYDPATLDRVTSELGISALEKIHDFVKLSHVSSQKATGWSVHALGMTTGGFLMSVFNQMAAAPNPYLFYTAVAGVTTGAVVEGFSMLVRGNMKQDFASLRNDVDHILKGDVPYRYHPDVGEDPDGGLERFDPVTKQFVIVWDYSPGSAEKKKMEQAGPGSPNDGFHIS